MSSSTAPIATHGRAPDWHNVDRHDGRGGRGDAFMSYATGDHRAP